MEQTITFTAGTLVIATIAWVLSLLVMCQMCANQLLKALEAKNNERNELLQEAYRTGGECAIDIMREMVSELRKDD